MTGQSVACNTETYQSRNRDGRPYRSDIHRSVRLLYKLPPLQESCIQKKFKVKVQHIAKTSYISIGCVLNLNLI